MIQIGGKNHNLEKIMKSTETKEFQDVIKRIPFVLKITYSRCSGASNEFLIKNDYPKIEEKFWKPQAKVIIYPVNIIYEGKPNEQVILKIWQNIDNYCLFVKGSLGFFKPYYDNILDYFNENREIEIIVTNQYSLSWNIKILKNIFFIFQIKTEQSVVELTKIK